MTELEHDLSDPPMNVYINVIFTQENGCIGGCGTYELDIQYPVENGNCHLDSMIGYETVKDEEYRLFNNGPACCSGISGTISHVYIDDFPDEDSVMTVRDFILKYSPETFNS